MEKNREYYESLDKRTKEYKEWKESQSTGLGDVVEKFTKATGIKSAVEHLFGEDCGCEERKEALNKFGSRIRSLFKKKVKIEFLEEQEFIFLRSFFNGRTKRDEIRRDHYVKMINIYNRVFHAEKDKNSSCVPCIEEVYDDLYELYKEYKQQTK